MSEEQPQQAGPTQSTAARPSRIVSTFNPAYRQILLVTVALLTGIGVPIVTMFVDMNPIVSTGLMGITAFLAVCAVAVLVLETAKKGAGLAGAILEIFWEIIFVVFCVLIIAILLVSLWYITGKITAKWDVGFVDRMTTNAVADHIITMSPLDRAVSIARSEISAHGLLTQEGDRRIKTALKGTAHFTRFIRYGVVDIAALLGHGDEG